MQPLHQIEEVKERNVSLGDYRMSTDVTPTCCAVANSCRHKVKFSISIHSHKSIISSATGSWLWFSLLS